MYIRPVSQPPLKHVVQLFSHFEIVVIFYVFTHTNSILYMLEVALLDIYTWNIYVRTAKVSRFINMARNKCSSMDCFH